MADLDNLIKLWQSFARKDRSQPFSLGIDDQESPHVSAWLSSEFTMREFNSREALVLRLAPGLFCTSSPLIAQTLPCWLSCVRTEGLLMWTHEFDTPAFIYAAASVLFSRTLRAALSSEGLPGRVPELATFESRFRRESELAGRSTALQLDAFRANYATLLRARAMRRTQTATGSMVRRTVIVHGTAAAGATWWRDPGGLGAPPAPDSLWQFLHNNGATNLVGAPDEFTWSGFNSAASRRQGAADFINWWNGLGAPPLDVIAHSHGGNVVMLASVMEPTLLLRRLVLLGTPARFDYVPRIGQTEHLHNVYSEYDGWQVPGSWGAQRGEGRSQSDHACGTNWHIPYWDASAHIISVGHSDLHHPNVWKNHKLMALLT